jgi:hypothetical protein
MEQFDLKVVGEYFSEVGKIYLGNPQMDDLEEIFKAIREGREELTVHHIRALRDEENKYWSFLNWWRMPEINENELLILRGAFVGLKREDKILVKKLFDILKNIEIVSCILRFIDPKNYGILSSPVESLLNIKGDNPVEKYLHYIENLWELKDHYKFKRNADVDMALWTLARILNSSRLKEIPRFREIHERYRYYPNHVKKLMARNSLEQIWEEKRYIDIAELFLETDPIVAGVLAGRELERFIKSLCVKHNIDITRVGRSGFEEYISPPGLAKKLSKKGFITYEEADMIRDLWETRCDLTHELKTSSNYSQIKKLIDWITDFIDKSLKKSKGFNIEKK